MWENLDYEKHQPSFDYTLSLISGKWKLWIIYHLSYHGVLRYNELHRLLGKVTHKTLSQTLKEMISTGLVVRKEYMQVPPKVEYYLTNKGESLFELMDLMCQWGTKNKPF
uniref:winged helix-turn-helix transcriptional regulator n=1 Tax=Candidatus Enterococcus willemsii TaxID=1857215 RepID=UPI00403EFAAD